MGWAVLLLAALVAGGALALGGVARRLWAFAGAALMLGAAGYAWQGAPTYAGHPVVAATELRDLDPSIAELRGAMFGRYTAEQAFATAADALVRAGASESAVRLLIGATGSYPDNAALWTRLGDALADHDHAVSPASLFAFRRAAQLAPDSPGPWFFLGLAQVRVGEFAAARGTWGRALALTPAGAEYRGAVAERLALLDRYLALMATQRSRAGPAE